MRTLYHVPLIHSPEELGSLKNAFLTEHVNAYGSNATQQFMQSVQAYWREISRRLDNHNFFQSKIARHLHVFIDSMPDAEHTIMFRIIDDLAAKNIPLYCLVKKLLYRGANVHGTEDVALLLKERAYWQHIASGQPHNTDEEALLLHNRDNCIAQHIDANLPEEGIGILFLGQLHNIRGALERQSICCNVIDL